MFGFIKKLFSGIGAFFSGLFGSKKAQPKQSIGPKTKKGDGYFMQLEEAEETKPAAASQTATAKSAAEALKPEPKKSPEPAAPVAVATPAPAKPSPAVEPKQPEPAKKPEPVAANNGKGQAQPSSRFASNYLMETASTKSRRRPGPSLDMFREMARQVKTPNS